MSSIRDRIRQIQVRLRDDAMTPDVARASLVALTALLGNVSDELRVADVEYRRHLLKCFEVEETANRAKLRADTSPEYERYRTAKDTQTLVTEMVRSCRAYLRSLDEEMRLSR